MDDLKIRAEDGRLLSRFNHSFYRSIDGAITDVPKELLANVAVIPHGSGAVPVLKQV